MRKVGLASRLLTLHLRGIGFLLARRMHFAAARGDLALITALLARRASVDPRDVEVSLTPGAPVRPIYHSERASERTAMCPRAQRVCPQLSPRCRARRPSCSPPSDATARCVRLSPPGRARRDCRPPWVDVAARGRRRVRLRARVALNPPGGAAQVVRHLLAIQRSQQGSLALSPLRQSTPLEVPPPRRLTTPPS